MDDALFVLDELGLNIYSAGSMNTGTHGYIIMTLGQPIFVLVSLEGKQQIPI